MLQGNIFAVTDPNILLNLSPTHVVICVSGDTHLYQDLIAATNAQVASILLPSYEACMAEADGNMMLYEQMYFQHLSTPEPAMYLALILRALYDGKNIILYLTKEEATMKYFELFLKFIAINYGIIIGNDPSATAFNSGYISTILYLLFMNNLLSGRDVLCNYPLDETLAPMIITKLANEINPYVTNKTLEGYTEYFERYRKESLKVGKPLDIAIAFGGN